jgi:hypothetical protein
VSGHAGPASVHLRLTYPAKLAEISRSRPDTGMTALAGTRTPSDNVGNGDEARHGPVVRAVSGTGTAGGQLTEGWSST